MITERTFFMKNYLGSLKGNFPIVVVLILCVSFSASGQSSEAKDAFSYSKKTYTYKIVENHNILADVYRNQNAKIQPAIIWIHGGALIFGTRKWLRAEQLELYLNAGYAVISIDYRLAPESKLEFILNDIEDAYKWVIEKGPSLFMIDPSRIAIIGHSAGGYLALTAGFRLKPRPDALVSFYGYGDISGDWYSQPDYFYNQSPTISRDQAHAVVGDSVISSTTTIFSANGRFQFYLYCRQQGLWPIEVSGHDPDKELGWFSECEPLQNVTANYPPATLLHGKKDTDVPFEQSAKMTDELKRHGIAHEFITNQNWGHVFDNAGVDDPTVEDAFNKILKFLEKHVK
jgi:acetyl esterase/lipase